MTPTIIVALIGGGTEIAVAIIKKVKSQNKK